MRAGDDLRKRTLRMAISAIRLAEIEKGRVLDEREVLAILLREVKSRHEAISEAQMAHRPELESAARAEITVLENYLPQPLSAEELETLARQTIAEVGATSAQQMGQVMKVLMPRLQGRASGDQTSQVVRKLLQQG
jgi:uncharacterized protein YqeY